MDATGRLDIPDHGRMIATGWAVIFISQKAKRVWQVDGDAARTQVAFGLASANRNRPIPTCACFFQSVSVENCLTFFRTLRSFEIELTRFARKVNGSGDIGEGAPAFEAVKQDALIAVTNGKARLIPALFGLADWAGSATSATSP